MKKYAIALLLTALVVAIAVFAQCNNHQGTTTRPAQQMPVALAIKQPVQAVIALGTDEAMTKASIIWVEADGGKKKATVGTPIGEEDIEVSIDTPEDDNSSRGVATTINLPDEQIRVYLVCIQGKIGKTGQLHRIYTDQNGTQLQDKDKAGPQITFRKVGKQGLAYVLITINPTKAELDEGIKLTQVTQSSLKGGGDK